MSSSILLIIVDIIQALTPIIPYFAQINTFKKQQSSKGFSIKISLFVLSAHILRIFFWFGERFNISLLFQSILLNITHLYLVKIYVDFAEKNEERNKESIFSDFWDWDNHVNYFITTLGFVLFLIGITFHLGFENKIYVNLLGSVSSILEAVMPCAQIVKLYNVKSAKSLSYVLVLSWVLGDSFKVYYYIITKVPIQMLISAIMQVLFELFIILQVFYYNSIEAEVKEDKETKLE